MSNPIGWCDITINPLVGCSKCSPGCDHCYAEKFAARLARNPKTAEKYAGVVDERGKWTGRINYEGWGCLDTLPRSPKRVFLGSMTDIFHENSEEAFEDLVDYMQYVWPQHTFLLLTKRPQIAEKRIEALPLPKNVWLGVTVCNQAEADAKLPILMEIRAHKRFVSIEPMLGPIALDISVCAECGSWTGPKYPRIGTPFCEDCGADPVTTKPGIDWIICGGETGPGARPMRPEWVRCLRDQCQNTGAPFYFKGWGGTKKAPALLDGREWREFPAQEGER
ncbi:DUF5131 family protein [Desulfovibrio sp. ZJ369]|uniref:DUF5131 family protein n=1 Tax=Desulfovibrio sp. ZJ369 TaxID=2709793 RepID=UPI0013ED284B|nr:DUF5131 family protein [Desulfovibrio sp. ZJ369]